MPNPLPPAIAAPSSPTPASPSARASSPRTRQRPEHPSPSPDAPAFKIQRHQHPSTSSVLADVPSAPTAPSSSLDRRNHIPEPATTQIDQRPSRPNRPQTISGSEIRWRASCHQRPIPDPAARLPRSVAGTIAPSINGPPPPISPPITDPSSSSGQAPSPMPMMTHARRLLHISQDPSSQRPSSSHAPPHMAATPPPTTAQSIAHGRPTTMNISHMQSTPASSLHHPKAVSMADNCKW